MIVLYGVAALLIACLSWAFSNAEMNRLERFLVDSGNHYHWSPWSVSPCDCSAHLQKNYRICVADSGQQVPEFACGAGISQHYSACSCPYTQGPTSIPVLNLCVDKSSACYPLMCTRAPQIAYDNCAATCGHCGPMTPAVHINDHWSEWTSYSSCSVTCGQGFERRYRSCLNGSGMCQGPSTEQAYCNMGTCPVDGYWGPWSPFTPCSHSCGTGMTIRSRTCSYPIPSAPGAPCHGDSYDRQACNAQSCIIDGQWSSWTDWSRCSVTCGLGTISRDRTCTSPAPSNGGRNCSEMSTETHDCSYGPCAEWGHWFEGSCSVSCGEGTRERLRHCSTGRDVDCPGNAQVIVNCTALICV
ncbi:adhesion G protein-coupled receptor B1-like isoform X3 [Dreissena polymorpha]|uniref:adhesion G protein-coupled receptor B1-like isoform X3 n=1 Tax=Dreissena polymorpha TaxID=45954 RepID=UPI0022651DA9|nr:adhesion G protein-coupled receptor B1-like isoform X3 [Dreissena polymorpha]